MHTDQEIAQGTDILESSKAHPKLLKTTSKLHCFKKSVFSSNCDPNIFRLVVLSLVVGSSRITSFTFSSKIIISVVERVFISAQLQNRRFSWRCRPRLYSGHTTPHQPHPFPLDSASTRCTTLCRNQYSPM